jgi:2-polyprenyl-3-methyl-5-hydroxy-6-metoxy-1,4-benzoquinol methylase
MITERFAGLRADLAFIAHWVAPGSRVLDLGCGDGAMMEYLQVDKHCSGYGVEIDDANPDGWFPIRPKTSPFV